MTETDRDEQDDGQDEGGWSTYPGAAESDRDAIEEERKRRLAPENRPDNTEVDNTGDNAPDLTDVDPSLDADGHPVDDGDGGDDGGDEERSEAAYPGAAESDRDAIEEERKRRLAPENRPDNTEVDNTGDNAPDLTDVDPAVDSGGD